MSTPPTDPAAERPLRVLDAPPSTKEPVRKELMQCQFCYRSRLAGATLSRCSGCQIAFYCVSLHDAQALAAEMTSLKSKECQKKGWPLHKETCKVNQRILENPTSADGMRKLRAFTTKHRPTLSQFGRRALDLYDHPENAQESVLLVVTRPRKQATTTETSFVVQDVLVGAPSLFGHNEEGIRGRMKYLVEENERVGGKGGFTAVMMDVETQINNVVGVGFTEDFERIDPGVDWKKAMMEKMNGGFVL
ncbi:hypothetical protein D9619_010011 [Psilocybe cf. subviscida]|uniref:MYND-type domain-containing protein n=1 Tax=Psilocybe cf. subviscida TaxID=2480587 RepID=A0A8H5BLM7_9AGAR|nr:hypothetical protein D9619_010011 [Psilocybe cf. subviscida]